MQLAEDELLPAITPVGHPAEKKSVSEALVRTGARSSRRKPWSALFFTGDGKTPLTEDEAGVTGTPGSGSPGPVCFEPSALADN